MYLKVVATASLLALINPTIGITQERGADFFAQWDSNADGAVTEAELLERRADIFAMFDTDGGDTLDEAELAVMADTISAQEEAKREEHAQFQPRGQGQGQGGGQKGLGRANVPGPILHNAMRPEFNEVDGDGLVTKAEFMSASERLFAALDRDASGKIDLADF